MKYYFQLMNNIMILTKYEIVDDNLHFSKFPEFLYEEYLGFPLFFYEEEENKTKKYYGYFASASPFFDFPEEKLQDIHLVKYPVAEYLIINFQGKYSNISTAYDNIKEILREKELNAIFHPIEIFNDDIPEDLDKDVDIDIYIATDANLNEYLPSDENEELINKISLNFYTS